MWKPLNPMLLLQGFGPTHLGLGVLVIGSTYLRSKPMKWHSCVFYPIKYQQIPRISEGSKKKIKEKIKNKWVYLQKSNIIIIKTNYIHMQHINESEKHNIKFKNSQVASCDCNHSYTRTSQISYKSIAFKICQGAENAKKPRYSKALPKRKRPSVASVPSEAVGRIRKS